MGTAVPPPRQLLHTMRPLPRQVLHPRSSSLQREHQHSTVPLPWQVSHSCRGPSSGWLCSKASKRGGAGWWGVGGGWAGGAWDERARG